MFILRSKVTNLQSAQVPQGHSQRRAQGPLADLAPPLHVRLRVDARHPRIHRAQGTLAGVKAMPAATHREAGGE